ncbi:hypothetical protein ACFL6S_00730 [Candidatus Poribacteria bacterium]
MKLTDFAALMMFPAIVIITLLFISMLPSVAKTMDEGRYDVKCLGVGYVARNTVYNNAVGVMNSYIQMGKSCDLENYQENEYGYDRCVNLCQWDSYQIYGYPDFSIMGEYDENSVQTRCFDKEYVMAECSNRTVAMTKIKVMDDVCLDVCFDW